jgi:small subunit ribosomal protein S9
MADDLKDEPPIDKDPVEGPAATTPRGRLKGQPPVVAKEPAEGGDDEASDADDTMGLTLGGGTPAEAEPEAAPRPAPTIRGKIDRFGTAMGTGRRKTSVARVRIKDGTGEFVINGRPFEQYIVVERDRLTVHAPLKATDMLGKVDISVNVVGGGPTGQAGAIILGIARALQAKNPANHPILAEGGFLTRDSRMVERKKYGHKKASRSFQFSKR